MTYSRSREYEEIRLRTIETLVSLETEKKFFISEYEEIRLRTIETMFLCHICPPFPIGEYEEIRLRTIETLRSSYQSLLKNCVSTKRYV